jgi:hypothetical protein
MAAEAILEYTYAGRDIDETRKIAAWGSISPAAVRADSELKLSTIKEQILRIAGNGTRSGFLFAKRMFEEFPELRDA